MPKNFQGEKSFTYGGRGDDAVSIERSFRELYYLINHLFSKSNVYAEGQDISYKGSPGDIRVVKVGETKTDPLYAIEAKTPDGWFRIKGDLQTKTEEKAAKFPASGHYLPLTPDYDSGWVQDASDDAAITLTHNLGVVDFRFHDLQLSNSSSGANPTWIHMSDDDTGGYIVQVHDKNTIKVGTNNNGPPVFDCAGLGWDGAASYFRLRLWK